MLDPSCALCFCGKMICWLFFFIILLVFHHYCTSTSSHWKHYCHLPFGEVVKLWAYIISLVWIGPCARPLFVALAGNDSFTCSVVAAPTCSVTLSFLSWSYRGTVLHFTSRENLERQTDKLDKWMLKSRDPGIISSIFWVPTKGESAEMDNYTWTCTFWCTWAFERAMYHLVCKHRKYFVFWEEKRKKNVSTSKQRNTFPEAVWEMSLSFYFSFLYWNEHVVLIWSASYYQISAHLSPLNWTFLAAICEINLQL